MVCPTPLGVYPTLILTLNLIHPGAVAVHPVQGQVAARERDAARAATGVSSTASDVCHAVNGVSNTARGVSSTDFDPESGPSRSRGGVFVPRASGWY